MFVNRINELEFLNKKFSSTSPELLVIMAEAEFAKDKPAVYFQASEANAMESLRDFSKVIAHHKLTDEPILFNAWEEAFELLFEKSKEKSRKAP